MTTYLPHQTTAIPAARQSSTTASQGAAAGDRGPWIAAVGTLAVVAFPAVNLMIEAVQMFFGRHASQPDPVTGVTLALMSGVLFAMPALVAQAVRRRSRGSLLLGLLTVLVIVLGSCWTFG